MMKNLLIHPLRTSLFAAAAVAAIGLPSGARAQNVYTWNGNANSNWLDASRWNADTSTFAGVTANSGISNGGDHDIAVFGVHDPAFATIRINMSDNSNNAKGSLTLGTIRLLSSITGDLAINNLSGGRSGYLSLTGNTFGDIANTIILNESGKNLHIRGEGPNGYPLDFQLGNPTENVVQINGSGNVEISSHISAGSGVSAPNLTLDGSGTGSLILTGLNSYGGTTLVRHGTLVAGSSTALGSSAVTLGGFSNDATLRVRNGVTLNLASLALTEDALLSFELGATSSTTKITTSGQLGDGTYQIGIVDAGGLESGEYILLEATGWDAADFSLTAPVAGFEGSYLSWDSGVLKLTVIPEPGVGALALCSGVALLGLWRLRRK